MESIREFMDDIDKILKENHSDSDINPFYENDTASNEKSEKDDVDSVISDLISKLEQSGDEEKAKKVLELSEKFVLELKEIIDASEPETIDYNSEIHSDEFNYPRS